MLEYTKTILMKVSFDRRLFEKELKKALNLILPHEIIAFKSWCYEKFGQIYGTILNKYFVQFA
ncbi:hypothetical protein [Penaeicola halotolerans]|uniref:hypothetical protein n=1 Tax=Penaeicola halotolerans TaxID=2793196 RepID=UPI001CF8E8E1|nr:hypothetical protein [Penaeicola halotolerans]